MTRQDVRDAWSTGQTMIGDPRRCDDVMPHYSMVDRAHAFVHAACCLLMQCELVA